MMTALKQAIRSVTTLEATEAFPRWVARRLQCAAPAPAPCRPATLAVAAAEAADRVLPPDSRAYIEDQPMGGCE